MFPFWSPVPVLVPGPPASLFGPRSGVPVSARDLDVE